VRIAGRDDELIVSLNWLTRDKTTIKFPLEISHVEKYTNPSQCCAASWVVQAQRTQHKAGHTRD
jgi:hypothetical protein